MAASCSEKKKEIRGFTLVELLVSLGIVGVIAGQMLANFRSGQRLSELRLAGDILASQVRAVQTESFSGRLVDVCSGGSEDGAVCEATKVPALSCGGGGVCDDRVPSGYGIRLDTSQPTEYVLFFDTDNDKVMDVGEEFRAQPYISTGLVRFSGADTVASPVDIVFTPPFGRIYVNGAQTGPSDIEFTLTHQTGNEERHVSINRITGKIERD